MGSMTVDGPEDLLIARLVRVVENVVQFSEHLADRHQLNAPLGRSERDGMPLVIVAKLRLGPFGFGNGNLR